MAELVEGTYAVISAQSGLALDVKGESDKSGANIRIHTVNSKDSQVWALTTRSSGKWQFLCSLTAKYMFVNSGKVANNSNVQQSSYSKKTSQTWDVVDAGSSYTYSGTSYPCFYIKNGANNGFAVAEAGTTAGSNVKLATFNSSAASQKWIFVPQRILKDGGTYALECAEADGDFVTVRSDSTADNATIGFTSFQDRNSQVFRVAYDSTTGLSQFIAAHSNKVLSSKGNKGTDGTPIVQLKNNNNSGQKFLVVQIGKTTMDYQGEILPTYEFRAQVGTNQLIEPISDTMKLGTRLNDPVQRWVLNKAEMESNSLTAPTGLTPALFINDDLNSNFAPVENLKFESKFTNFQARYSNEYYDYDGKLITKVDWVNLSDCEDDEFDESEIDAAARNGWGDAWEPTFSVQSSGTIDLPFLFSKWWKSKSNARLIKTIIEVRAFSSNVNGFVAHGPAKQTVIKSIALPTVTVDSMDLIYDEIVDKFGIKTTFSIPYTNYFNVIRCRISDSNGNIIGEPVQSSSMSVVHYLGSTLHRLPSANESLVVSFEGSLVDADYLLERTITHTFTSSLSSITITMTYPDDESCCAVASVPYTSGRNYLCFVQYSTEHGTDFMQVSLSAISQNQKLFKFYPQLNKDVQVLCIEQYFDNSTNIVKLGTATCNVSSHLFIWNWTTETGIEKHAALIVNSDKPPVQSRILASEVSYNNVAGRRYPVGFAGKTIDVDLNIEGVVIDETQLKDQTVYIPTHGKLSDILSLSVLSGKGIHPLYRTPYGDFYKVAISNVNASKSEMLWTPITVTQKVVDD